MNETLETQSKDNTVSDITEEERCLAEDALSAFQNHSYELSLSHLNKLESLRPMDLKVTHNKVVVEYYKSDLKKTELMRKSLNAICGQISTTNSSETIDDVERCVMRYNQAILLYHTRQYNSALQIVNKLFILIEPMEETLARKVCLLLIELHIVMERTDAAMSVLNYVENQLVSTDSSKMSCVDKDGGIKSIKEQKEQKKVVNDAAMDVFRMKLLKYKTKIYLLTHQLRLCKKEWKTLVLLDISMNASMILLKANLEYLRGNYKKAMKLLNTPTENLDFKLCGESSAVLYYNNMACVHFAMGKPHLACFYLQEALRQNKHAVESVQVKNNDILSSQPLYTLDGNKHYQLMYNLGVSLLHTGQAAKALDCFTEAAQTMHNSPKLWLRMAECCIHSHKNSNKIDVSKQRKDMVQEVIGSGIYKKIILTPSLSKNVSYHAEGLPHAIPQPTLEFGSLCLKNALFLLSNNKSCKPVTNIANSQTMSLLLTSGHNLGNLGMQHTTLISQTANIEYFNLKLSVLAASAYISLCLGDYILAFEHANTLLNFNKLPGAYKLLGNLYAAESLIFMDKINEALEYLKLENLQDMNTFTFAPEVLEKDKEKGEEVVEKFTKAWYPTTVSTGIAILRYNLAVAYAIRGELDKSGETLKQIWMSKRSDCDIPIQVLMLALYIELQLGHTDVSRSIIKQHCPQYR